MDAAWHRALAYALTGADLSLGVQDGPDVPQLAEQLAASGWTPQRIAAQARERGERGEAWPHPIPDALRAGLGAAQLLAALGRARTELGLVGLDQRGPSRRTALTGDERRLLADLPPHHVPH